MIDNEAYHKFCPCAIPRSNDLARLQTNKGWPWTYFAIQLRVQPFSATEVKCLLQKKKKKIVCSLLTLKNGELNLEIYFKFSAMLTVLPVSTLIE